MTVTVCTHIGVLERAGEGGRRGERERERERGINLVVVVGGGWVGVGKRGERTSKKHLS
jgi:hypothetical protein